MIRRCIRSGDDWCVLGSTVEGTRERLTVCGERVRGTFYQQRTPTCPRCRALTPRRSRRTR